MITDLDKIKQLGEEREKENFDFRSWLKMQDPKKTDKMVHRLNQFYITKIECTTCGNCCIVIRPLVSNKDINRITRHLNMSEDEFEKEYTEIDDEGDRLLTNLPFKFLENKICSIYPCRPFDCKSYPHLHKKDFTYRLFGVIDNYSVCPIVFNVYEDLKLQLGFKT
jgi:Fe-S-cluster containining protein